MMSSREPGSSTITSLSTSDDGATMGDGRLRESRDLEKAADVVEQQNVDSSQLYSQYTHRQKVLIVMMASLAALFSPLSANIYYPALDVLAKDLNVSSSDINLTVTTYLIFQGLAPSFIGTFSDTTGRRPAYLACFTIYIGACIGLALQDKYAALLVLRCVQSSGSSGTVALASAVVADIVTSAERGTYIGYAQIGALIGPALGPIVGGLLCEYLTWRATFWFLVIFSGVAVIIIGICLPETCRTVVGNGSIPPQSWNISLLSYLTIRRQRKAGIAPSTSQQANIRKHPNPLNTIWIILDKESGIVLLYAGALFAGYYMVITGMPSQFTIIYNFNTLQIGLCYIPAGVGSMFAAFVSGRFIDWNFRRHARKVGMEVSKARQQDLTNFPIELARLQVVLPQAFASIAFVIMYGWFLEARVHLAGVLICLFLLTFCVSGTFQALSTLVVDLNRDAPGTATAAMNLARCWLGAAGVAAVVPMINAIGNGWVGVVVAGMWLCMTPASIVVIRYGPRWRVAKREREIQKRAKLEAEKAPTNSESNDPSKGA